ncbi:uncharacterized oxidoreductase At1g06690, chloroplastic-like [Pyrus communis]|uniref:uncharacterized oxidoreductase At1g06690, chloroplastic-like n=1 Tax=Pyrus communis TaxID=23211 RepID=UPI0035BFF4AD
MTQRVGTPSLSLLSILDLLPLESKSVTARHPPPRLDISINIEEVTVIKEVNSEFDSGDRIGGQVHRVVEGHDQDSLVASAKRVGRVDVAAADRKMKVAKAAFDASVDGGITFFDTAEVYGSRASFGVVNSETLLGRFIKERKQKDPGVEVVVATKFATLPWRLGRQSVIAALKDSLNRLELSSVELYQLHWPGIWGNEGYLDDLGDAVEQGLVKAVGVSNYSQKRLREAHAKLQKRGIPLVSNQVNYSLIYRVPRENGVKSTCDELGITLIAYSPIAQGALTGKYTPENPPTGPRRQIYTEFLSKLQSLLNWIKEIGETYIKTNTQVVLNLLIAQDNVVPIPGTKNEEQAAKFAGALGWRLNSEEVAELRALATEIKPVTGFPVEKF